MMKKIICVILIVFTICFCLVGCDYEVSGSTQDKINTIEAENVLQKNQPTPTDISYSLERYNLIRRTYWVNGQREKANSLPCEIEKPLGYIVLFSGNAVVGSFVVDGKVTSLNSYLTPDSEYYEQEYGTDGYSKGDGNDWLADVDGSYGEMMMEFSSLLRMENILNGLAIISIPIFRLKLTIPLSLSKESNNA